jgi:hypothetical protein
MTPIQIFVVFVIISLAIAVAMQLVLMYLEDHRP